MVAFLNTEASRHILTESTLLSELVSKLPPTKQLEWTQYSMMMEGRPTVVDFSKWLKRIAECVSILTSSSVTPLTSTHNRPTVSNSQQNRRTGKHVLLSASQSTSNLNCEMCSGTHTIIDCQRFRNLKPADKWAEAKRMQLCFQCLQSGHSIGCCDFEPKVGGKGYHELLHSAPSNIRRKRRPSKPNKQNIKQPTVASEAPAPEDPVASTSQSRRPNPFDRPPQKDPAVYVCHNGIEDSPASPLFRILPVTLYGPDRHAETYALLDEGSALTLISEDLSDYLQLSGVKSRLGIQWIGQHGTSERSRTVQLSISGSSQRKFELNGVRTIKGLNLPQQTLNSSQFDSRMRSLPIAEYSNVTPNILIGLDHCRLEMERKTITSREGGPIAAQTSLGWVVYGPQSTSSAHILHIVEADRWDYLEHIIREYFTTVNFGVKQPQQELESDGDTRARYLLQSTTSRTGDRFQTGLLWKNDDTVLPDSFGMARQRLATIERKMMRAPDYKQLFTQQIEAYLIKGYARRLSKRSASQENFAWYSMPQHPSKEFP